MNIQLYGGNAGLFRLRYFADTALVNYVCLVASDKERCGLLQGPSVIIDIDDELVTTNAFIGINNELAHYRHYNDAEYYVLRASFRPCGQSRC